jgi:hypothetical protein
MTDDEHKGSDEWRNAMALKGFTLSTKVLSLLSNKE